MTVRPIPDDYPQVIPYLTIDGAADAIDFYVKVLGAKERMRMPGPDGKIGHAELEIGRGMVMVSDAFPELGGKSPKTVGGTPVMIMAYVEDVDEVFQRALGSGAKELRPVENQFYGDRAGQFEDPFGPLWYIATHVEDISDEEVAKRAAEAMDGG